MSTLKAHEKIIFEKLFDRGGYVLDFTDRTYAEFFREPGVNIDVQLQAVIEQRVDEILKAMRADASLATVFLCGSTLEGLLLDAATKRPQ